DAALAGYAGSIGDRRDFRIAIRAALARPARVAAGLDRGAPRTTDSFAPAWPRPPDADAWIYHSGGGDMRRGRECEFPGDQSHHTNGRPIRYAPQSRADSAT